MAAYTRNPQNIPDDTPGGSTVRQGVKDQNSASIDQLFVNLNAHSNNEDGRSHFAIDSELTAIQTDLVPQAEAARDATVVAQGLAEDARDEAVAQAVIATEQVGLCEDQVVLAETAKTGAETAEAGAVAAEAGAVAAKTFIETYGRKSIISSLTVTVGPGGDYSTINAALEYLSKYQPIYKSAGITATINLLPGFVMAEQVLVRGLDMGWVTITGDDAETIIDHTVLTTDFTTADYGFDSFPAFGVSKGGMLPRIGQLFRFSVAGVGGNKHGIMAIGASRADILNGCGVEDAGREGIYACNASAINAIGAIATGAFDGIFAKGSSNIYAANADASGSSNNGIYASGGAFISAENALATDCGGVGVFANRGSFIDAYTVNATGAGSYGISVANGSIVAASNASGTLIKAANTLTSVGIIFQ